MEFIGSTHRIRAQPEGFSRIEALPVRVRPRDKGKARRGQAQGPTRRDALIKEINEEGESDFPAQPRRGTDFGRGWEGT